MRGSARFWGVVHAIMILCMLALIAIAWSVPQGNPRDGWSMIRVWVGMSPMPGSGDRAYQISSYSMANTVPIAVEGYEGHGSVLVRRDRRGLFVPSIETFDVHLIHLQTQTRWASGSEEPAFHAILRSIRPAYTELAAQRGAWYQRVVDSIDGELGGRYPSRSIRGWMLAVDVLALVAHLGLLYYVIRVVAWMIRYRPRVAEGGPVLYERAP